jgi:hypothetical protein
MGAGGDDARGRRAVWRSAGTIARVVEAGITLRCAGLSAVSVCESIEVNGGEVSGGEVEGRARAGAQKGRMDAEGSNGSAGDGAARTESTRAGRKHDRISHRSSYPHPSRRRVRPRRPAMARTRCAQSCVADAWLPFKKWFPPRPELAPTVVPRAPERANRDPPSFTDARVTLPELHRARIRCDRDTRDATRCSV